MKEEAQTIAKAFVSFQETLLCPVAQLSFFGLRALFLPLALSPCGLLPESNVPGIAELSRRREGRRGKAWKRVCHVKTSE